MTTLLHIDASPRAERSLTRTLSASFIDSWQRIHPDDQVIRRDIGLQPPPALTEAWIAAAFTAPEARTPAQHDILGLSDTLISELERADVVVIGTPMHNYGMPTALKAWVDHVIRIGRTFSFDLERGDFPLRPILSGKHLALLTSAGEFGFEPGGARESMNHLDTHIRAIQHYLGIAQTHHVAIEYQEFGDQRHKQSVDDALAAIDPTVRTITSQLSLAA
ncbi:FMN-dependent NADH-azoreductase [Pacificispira sp.]|uniref:FMN-dependent NADH-azoreductase n=1 Tax=Pacificispira sp. TaxID=2888761 RepID=UPI003BA921AD